LPFRDGFNFTSAGVAVGREQGSHGDRHVTNKPPIRKGGRLSRRGFLKRASGAAMAAVAAPLFVRTPLLGAAAPGNRIVMGSIGTGRMGTWDMRTLLEFPEIQVVATCDVDAHRVVNSKGWVDRHYGESGGAAGSPGGCKTYGDFRELLARDDIDAVTVVTPDHWHGLPSIAAVRAGKDVFVQKPMTLSIPEGRVLSDAVHEYGRVLQVGCQQRSDVKFRLACELVRNGCIGKLHTVKVGIGTDPGTTPVPPTVPPQWLDYDLWLGPAPYTPYIEKCVHPRDGFGRPGWLRVSDYTCGMITAWGAHHVDIAHWGMDVEHTGPLEVSGSAEFPTDGPWDVHGAFQLEYLYANGVRMTCTDNRKNPQGVTFVGDKGWVYVRRGFIDASDKSLLRKTFGPTDVRLYLSNNHKGNFVECMKTRKDPIAPVEIVHRSNSACILGYMAMTLGRKLKWNPDAEQFIGDDEANRLLVRPMRGQWRL